MAKSDRSRDRGYQSILSAVDFSPQSSAALQMAAELTRRFGGHLTVLCVDPLSGPGAVAVGYDQKLVRKSTLRQLDSLMERVVGPIGLGSNAWSVETVIGKPAHAIVKFARRINADLLVMGTNGRRGPAKLFLGSVAQAVLRQAPAPVLVVPRSQPRRAALKVQTRPVLGALELGANEVADARRIARAAAMLGGPLTLLHVVTRVPDLLGSPAQVDPYHHRQLLAARKKIEQIANGVEAASRVALGIPEDEIADVASEMKAGLIVLALRRGRGLFGSRQGTTTYRILCASRTPVLALPTMANR
jgi:nucleotide-binding universal stress UspA family protein